MADIAKVIKTLADILRLLAESRDCGNTAHLIGIGVFIELSIELIPNQSTLCS